MELFLLRHVKEKLMEIISLIVMIVALIVVVVIDTNKKRALSRQKNR